MPDTNGSPLASTTTLRSPHDSTRAGSAGLSGTGQATRSCPDAGSSMREVALAADDHLSCTASRVRSSSPSDDSPEAPTPTTSMTAPEPATTEQTLTATRRRP